jgi:hypothetical protein
LQKEADLVAEEDVLVSVPLSERGKDDHKTPSRRRTLPTFAVSLLPSRVFSFVQLFNYSTEIHYQYIVRERKNSA